MARFRREMARALGWLQDLLAIWPDRIAQARADAAFPAGLRQTGGALAAADRIALLLIWQPGGVAASTHLTLRHLAGQGYAPLVVSNAPLSEQDRTDLAVQSWLVVERPNRGHDFGGYRDGIRLLRHLGLRPARLLLLNDSIWFPLCAEDGLIRRMEAAPGSDGFSGAVWLERPGRAHRAHYQSYFLMFGPRALAHPAFWRYWDRYLASSRRSAVLKRGEKGLSAAMGAAGLVAPPLISPQSLLDHARAASDADLRLILSYAALADPARAARRDRLLAAAGDADFRNQALALISSTLTSGAFPETQTFLAARAFGMHFLKKRREATSAEARRQVLRAVAAGDLPAPQPAMLAEIRAATDPAP